MARLARNKIMLVLENGTAISIFPLLAIGPGRGCGPSSVLAFVSTGRILLVSQKGGPVNAPKMPRAHGHSRRHLHISHPISSKRPFSGL